MLIARMVQHGFFDIVCMHAGGTISVVCCIVKVVIVYFIGSKHKPVNCISMAHKKMAAHMTRVPTQRKRNGSLRATSSLPKSVSTQVACLCV